MFGLPFDFDAHKFVGCVLQSVTFTANTVRLDFYGGVFIQVESTYSHSKNAGRFDERVSVPPQSSELMQMVESSVVEARSTSNGVLQLSFSNGHGFACYDDSSTYECYQIRLDGRDIYV